MKYYKITFSYDQGLGARNRYGTEVVAGKSINAPTEEQIKSLGELRLNFGSRHVIGNVIKKITKEEFLAHHESLTHYFA